MSHFLITGGCGFIGLNLIDFLNRKQPNINITVLDNLSVGKKEHLDAFDVDFIEGDIRDQGAVNRALKGVDKIVHLAADTRVLESIKNPDLNFDVNVVGTYNLLRAAHLNSIRSFVMASTGGAILGDAISPVHEEMTPHPLSPYGASKLMAEGYLSAFAGSYGMHTVALRFSNVYGKNSFHKGSVIAKMFKTALCNEVFEVYGDGSQTRDYIFVEDLSLPNSGSELFDQIRSAGHSIDILINNAGYGRWGEFTSHERDDYLKMVQLNITTLTDLCHLYIPDMITRGGGGIINVGSMASLSPIPYASVYSSSKAYVLMFSEAIRYEYRDQGIKVMALLPGGTESEFAKVATEKSEKLTQRYNKRSSAGEGMQTSHEVALECLDAFERNKQYILCGAKNRFLYMFAKFMSRERILEMIGGMFKKVAG